MRSFALPHLPWLALFALVTLTGCGPDPLASTTAVRLRGLANMYLTYAASKGGGPPSEDAFKKYLRGADAIQLQMANIDPKQIDTVFVSERDKQPFVIVYNKPISRISGDTTEVIAYEKTGQSGKHLIAYLNAKVDHVDDAKLKALLAAKDEGASKQ